MNRCKISNKFPFFNPPQPCTMFKPTLLLLVAFVVIAMSSAVPKPGEDRLKDLSDAKHYDGEEHNSQYDHEAFLGKDEAKTFDQLSPEESQRRLG